MTVTDPSGERPLLRAVLDAEHERLAHLAAELRSRPPTPGVVPRLVASLAAELRSHVHLEAAFLRPHVAAHLDRSDLAAMDRESVAVDTVADEVEALADAAERHRERVDGLLDRLADAVGDGQMAALGVGYGRHADAAVPPVPGDRAAAPGRPATPDG